MANAINWFEIPVLDFDRALKFYSTVLGTEMVTHEMNGTPMGFFPTGGANDGVGGALVKMDMMKPGADGVRVYLNGGEDLSDPLSRVEAAGGTIVVPKTKINDEIGYFAWFMDTEGNILAFHSQK